MSRVSLYRTTCSALFVVAIVITISQVARANDKIDFNRDIRPILSDNCFACHGPDKKHREADLRMDTREGALEGEAIVPGKPDESAMMERILSDDDDERMPPPVSNRKLSDKQKKLLADWIAQGAPYEEPWTYSNPKSHPVPKVKNTRWVRNFIDTWILARLEREKLQPAPEADRRTLIRRLSFDLTGLPPTPAEVDAFVADKSPNAYEKVVDRLLASPHFGERMAAYWLDLVRFADTVGYHGDQDHNVSPYRDWIIHALNNNMPFDEFTRAQIAGDLVATANPKLSESERNDLLVATCYNRLLQTSHEGGVQKKEYLAIYAADRIRNVSNVWMGATLGCAQCHDHKYDPYTMKDFYSMQAFFADIDEAQHFKVGSNSLPTKRPPEIDVLSPTDRGRIAQLTAQIAKLDKAKDAKQIAELTKQKAEIEKRKRRVMITKAIKPRMIRMLPRGNWLDDSGDVMKPEIPDFLGDLEMADRPANRLDLANWFVDAENGTGLLTARVQVNRYWYLMFGVGLAKVLDDFGGQGEPPMHPELLDALAIEFVKSGWDVKHMLRLIVTSSAYRQSSLSSVALRKRDPDNRLYARQSRHRLPAEMIRDNALAIGGLLVDELGGASVKPYQPPGYYRHLNFPQRRYSHHADPRQWRRGVYVHWQRQFLHPMLKAFDAPSREECTAERPRSNTPTAALVLLNDPTFVEAARAFAVRILRDGGDNAASRINFAYREAISRTPSKAELAIVQQLLEANQIRYTADEKAAKELITTGQSPVPSDLKPVDLAAWTMVARAVLNLNETITRN